jgi:hypothetical protein
MVPLNKYFTTDYVMLNKVVVLYLAIQYELKIGNLQYRKEFDDQQLDAFFITIL